jgi:hypothetical protein
MQIQPMKRMRLVTNSALDTMTTIDMNEESKDAKGIRRLGGYER